MELLKKAQDLAPELIQIRRHLHQNPELGMHEVKTQAYLIQKLNEIGAEVVTYPGQNAVVGILKGYKPGKCVALRADMDALPVCENSGLEFSSQNHGVMHACGHDAYMT
ncbi:MAG: amidohydrolase, partial [Clostridia bacterium]|nr:amidohydrolase [Clostridia bacterium]